MPTDPLMTRRALTSVAISMSRLCLIVGALSGLALLVGLVGWLFGGERFPAPFTGGMTGFGTFAWRVAAVMAGAWLLSRACVALIPAIGTPHDADRALGRDDEGDQLELSEPDGRFEAGGRSGAGGRRPPTP